MVSNELSEQERIWGLLYDRISQLLKRFGTEDHFGDADYLLVDDNYGWKRHTIEIHKLRMLTPAVVKMLQELLRDLPDWQIVLALDIPGTENQWPRMGLRILTHEIIDDLKRQYLPSEFRDLQFG
jgi:hypothetical protein